MGEWANKIYFHCALQYRRFDSPRFRLLSALHTKLPALRSPLFALRSSLLAPLFFFLLAIYLLTYTPRINSSDGLAMFATAESLVRRGAVDIEQIRWMDLQQGTYGLDGLLYSRKGIGVPLALLPLVWLGLIVPWLGPVSVSLLFNALVTALTAVLLLAYLRELGFRPQTGLIVALTFGLTTLAWPYAKSLFSDPFSGLLLLAAAYALLKMSRGAGAQGRRGESDRPSAPPRLYASAAPFLAGLFLAWNVATRYAEALFLPVYGLLLLYYLGLRLKGPDSLVARVRSRSLPPHFWGVITAFCAPILITGLALIAFNISRYGDPFNTGYLPNETFSGVWWRGIVGQLISPGRGLLLFSPIFLLSLWGLPTFVRRFRPEALLALSIIVIHLLLYGKWFMWHGGFAWGPRFMIPTLPFWALFLAPAAVRAFPQPADRSDSNPTSAATGSPTVEANRPRLTAVFKFVFIGLALLGLVPQFLTVLLDFTPYQGWLLDTGLPLFAPQTFFQLRYSPFLQAWSFISPDTLDLAWVWGGQLNGWLLSLLGINILITAFYLRQQVTYERRPKGEPARTVPPSAHLIQGAGGTGAIVRLDVLAYLSTLITVVFLLSHAHTLPPKSLQDTVEILNQNIGPTDAVITNLPELTEAFAERYKGRAPVLGLNHGDSLPDDVRQRVVETIANHPQIWWLPNWLPPEASAVEQTLLATSIPVRNDRLGDQRLVLFANPDHWTTQAVSTKATFAGLIALTQVSYPPTSPPGAALPVALQWHGLAPIAEDYHVFVHLVDKDDQIVAQADGQPDLWRRPTSTWAAGETIIDRYGLWLQPDMPPGDYQLRIGLYLPADGHRLSLPDSKDAVQFKVTIE